MTRPGFRKGRPGGGRAPAVEGDGFLSSSLFSQAQILHLMKNEFARARRHGIPMGIVLMQVDRLAQLADLHGAQLRTAVKQGIARLVRETGSALAEIEQAIATVVADIAGISSAGAEQATAVGEIGTTISALDDATQRNAHMAEDGAARAAALAAEARALETLVDAFTLDAALRRAA